MTELAVRTRHVSFRLPWRSIFVAGLLAVALALVSLWSVLAGDYPLTPSQVWSAMAGSGEAGADFVVRTLRLPRILTGALVGMALGMSGAAFQSLAQNPLGSPDIIGFDRGAAVGAIVALTMFPAVPVAVGAVAGGMITAGLVYVFAWQRGVRSYRLVLVGIGVGFTATALVDFLLTRAEINQVEQATVWITGSLNGRTWQQVSMLAVGLAVLAPAIVGMQRSLDRLALGDDTAVGLGIGVERAKLLVVLLAVTLAALAVAAAGPVAFVAFVSGPIARRLAFSPGACLVPAALVGAVVTVGADVAARSFPASVELPVGIATSLIGAPYLLWILACQVKAGVL